jgi:predicted GTPase
MQAEHSEGLADWLLSFIGSQSNKAKAPLPSKKPYAKLANTYLENQDKTVENSNKSLTLAILGRQNFRKSTLVHSLLKQNRVIAREMAGLTHE